MITLEEQLKQYIFENEVLMDDLRRVREWRLPQCYIAAGYIRNHVWDRLHGFENRARHTDIDVVYFDPVNHSEDNDYEIESELIRATGNPKWSVKNQARMHLRNGHAPYSSTLDALRRWPEVATAVGANLDDNDHIGICCPHGLDDLFGLMVRRSPWFEDRNYYFERVRKKKWKKQWPLLTIIDE